MAVKSYLLFPTKGKSKALEEKLKMHTNFELLKAENKDVLVLVTESDTSEEEDKILETLKSMRELDHFTLVSGYKEESDAN